MYHLLIVDDEENIADGLADLFRDSQLPLVSVNTAYSASQALERCRTEPVDIVLSDIRMPGMSGLDLQDRIREHWQHVIFIFLTGYADFEYAKRALLGRAFDYLLKPAEDEELIEAVKRSIEIHEAEMNPDRIAGNRSSVPAEEALPKRVTDEGFLRNVQTFIANNLNKDLSLEALAGKFYVNPSYLSRIFHQQSGEQLSHYIERTKMAAAKNMLEDHMLKVYEVAELAGYRNPNYFAKVFRKTYGMSPHEYRIQIGLEQ
ncbi:YesN/AraC family two-component response regulator [Paenibacillus phyllosphaerae]|uniref:YesN/AraC family two-component response regulator n=1 Tax=Paenibacillus phyllosphaerae TaxID=274593 RepID=A0A7W5AZQ8_9BACL|nr:response regulator [Paenibacillus phyllosphaerae]MBB3111755.1 YesN/AraC family two-component response regulator [Paenibacillus phyllosphaerae]